MNTVHSNIHKNYSFIIYASWTEEINVHIKCEQYLASIEAGEQMEHREQSVVSNSIEQNQFTIIFSFSTRDFFYKYYKFVSSIEPYIYWLQIDYRFSFFY